jgi:hypothetical protein
VLARELTPEELEHGVRYLTCEHDVDGALVIRGRVPADEGALVMAALEAGRDQLRNSAARPDSGAEDTCPPRPSNPDALLLMADTLLASGPADRTGGERYQVVVHVDIDALSGEANGNDDGRQPGEQSHLCRLEHGEALDPETARRLACDASVVSILPHQQAVVGTPSQGARLNGARNRLWRSAPRGASRGRCPPRAPRLTSAREPPAARGRAAHRGDERLDRGALGVGAAGRREDRSVHGTLGDRPHGGARAGSRVHQGR